MKLLSKFQIIVFLSLLIILSIIGTILVNFYEDNLLKKYSKFSISLVKTTNQELYKSFTRYKKSSLTPLFTSINSNKELNNYGLTNFLIFDVNENLKFDFSQFNKRLEPLNKEYYKKKYKFLYKSFDSTSIVSFYSKDGKHLFYYILVPCIDENGNHPANIVYIFSFNELINKDSFKQKLSLLGFACILISLVSFLLLIHNLRQKVKNLTEFIFNKIERNNRNYKKIFNYEPPFDILEEEIAFIAANYKIQTNKLKRLSNKFDFFVQQTQDGVLINDLEGRITFCNQKFASILNYESKEDLIGEKITDLFFDLDSVKIFNEEVIERTEQFSSTIKVNFADRKRQKINCLLSCSNVIDEKGETEFYYTTITDISKLELAKNIFSESKMKRINIFRSMKLPLFCIDLNNRIIDTNIAFCNLIDIPESLLLNRNYISVLSKYTELVTHLKIKLDKINQKEKFYFFEPRINKWLLINIYFNSKEGIAFITLNNINFILKECKTISQD